MNENSIKIRPLEEQDLRKSNWLKWLSDYETTKYQDLGYFPQNYNRQIAYLNSKLISNNDILFAVEYKKKNDNFIHVGNVGLHSIDLIHRRCSLGIIIGEKEYRGKGIGSFSWKFITKHAFWSGSLLEVPRNDQNRKKSGLETSTIIIFEKQTTRLKAKSLQYRLLFRLHKIQQIMK